MAPARWQPAMHDYERDDQENVNVSSQRVRADQTQRPENKQYDGYGP